MESGGGEGRNLEVAGVEGGGRRKSNESWGRAWRAAVIARNPNQSFVLKYNFTREQRSLLPSKPTEKKKRETFLWGARNKFRNEKKKGET